MVVTRSCKSIHASDITYISVACVTCVTVATHVVFFTGKLVSKPSSLKFGDLSTRVGLCVETKIGMGKQTHTVWLCARVCVSLNRVVSKPRAQPSHDY